LAGRVDAGHESQKRALAGAIVPHDTQSFSGVHIERKSVEGFDLDAPSAHAAEQTAHERLIRLDFPQPCIVLKLTGFRRTDEYAVSKRDIAYPEHDFPIARPRAICIPTV